MPPFRTRQGFTLVELLVVIIIIAILMAILIPTINAARNSARRAVIATEISQLESAIEEYKTKSGGDFPPDFSQPQRVLDHLSRAFPRHLRLPAQTWMLANNDVSNPGTWRIDQAEALVIWLSGLRKDPLYPVNGQTTERHIYFDFRPERLLDKDGDGFPEYYPPGTPGCPYVYFHSSSYFIDRTQPANPFLETSYIQQGSNRLHTAMYPDVAGTVYANHATLVGNGVMGVARPYATNALVWAEPTKFQIIAAGLDDDYGADYQYKIVPMANQVPTGQNLQAMDWDNMTSFAKGKQIKDMMP